MHPLTFSILFVNNLRNPGAADLITYLGQTSACVTQLPHLPDNLTPYQVIVVDPFHIKANELHRLQKYVATGGGCLGITITIPKDGSAADLFGVLPKEADPDCEVRFLFTNRTNPLGIRLPDAFYVSGPFLPLTVQDDDVEVVLYADWRYTHQAMLTCRSFGAGMVALTTTQDLNHPTLQRIIYRLLRRLGYDMFWSGKWHLTYHPDGCLPDPYEAYGFTLPPGIGTCRMAARSAWACCP